MLISKINFLLKSGASNIIIFLFLIQKIRNLFIKIKIIKQKKKNKKILREYIITHDWFSSNAYFFKSLMSKLPEKFNYLEIGSYEGNSAIFVATNYPKSSITCVDPWVNYQENKTESFENIEKIFDSNCKNFYNLKKIKSTSDVFFLNDIKKYQFIYVDGYHKYEYVLRDCLNSWSRLLLGGYLVCDDYIWQYYNDIEMNPCYAINEFIKIKKNELKVIYVTNSQIFIKKIK